MKPSSNLQNFVSPEQILKNTEQQSLAPRKSIENSQVNAMSIDVEDWFQVSAFKNQINRNDWDQLECRVAANTEAILLALEQAQIKATFFTLGWVAQRYPATIKAIVDAGHELASHGYGHQMVTELSRDEFRTDLLKAKHVLEQTGGVRVVGYRAPSFSIGRDNLWAHDVLLETGHQYSSSIYPIKHDLYGMPEAPRFAHFRPNGLLEIPATSVRLWSRNFPASGGGFFRLYPSWLSDQIIRRINQVDNQPAVFYCHPWEFDPLQPRVNQASLKSKFRHYLNLKKQMPRFQKLLNSHNWAPIRDIYCDLLNPKQDLGDKLEKHH
jgi:polysaccharide deacetylase family protein (PEP-CTERM system associated)